MMGETNDDPAVAVAELGQVASTRYSSKSLAVSKEGEDSRVGNGGDSLTLNRALVLLAMSFLWTASQLPLYFYGSLEPRVLESIGGYESSVWIVQGNLVPLAIVTPLVGNLADIFGRKSVGLVAFVFIIIGNLLCAVAPSINLFIVGSVLMGVGAGIGELIAIAVAGEIAPPRKRGFYVFGIILSILPFGPVGIYGQLMAYASTWRWVGLLIGVWCLIGFVLMAVFYRPPPRVWEQGLSQQDLIKRFDYVGSFLSATGLTLFQLGLSFAIGLYSWTSAAVLVPFFVGIALIIGFIVWEARFVKYPMFPARLKQNPRVLTVVMIITFASGANFFAVLVYWPTQYQNLYADDSPFSQGVASLPVGFGIILGSLIVTFLLSLLKGRIRVLMMITTAIMTATNGAMACATIDNLSTLWPIIALTCIGVGAVIVPLQVVAGIICPPDLIGTITAATIAIRVIGGSIAYAVYYNVFVEKFREVAPTIITPVAQSLGINSTAEISAINTILQGGGYSLLASLPGITSQADVDALTHAGKLALSESFPIVYYVSIAFGGCSFIASFFLTGIEKEMKGRAAVLI